MAEVILGLNVKSTRVVYILCGIVYLGFGLEILGILLTDKRLAPLLQPHAFLGYLGNATIALTVLAPFPALLALARVRSASRETESAGLRFLMWFVVVLGVFVSLAESMWTCSGHPTWIQGFPG